MSEPNPSKPPKVEEKVVVEGDDQQALDAEKKDDDE